MLRLAICAKICRCDVPFTINRLPTVVDDDLDPLITCCPSCDTRFRVTEAQLQVASGRVRCGACLNVFDGTEHLMLDEKNIVAAENGDVGTVLDELEFEIGDEANSRQEAVMGEPGPDLEETEGTLRNADLEEQHAYEQLKWIEMEKGGGTQSTPGQEAEARLKVPEGELIADIKGVLNSPIEHENAGQFTDTPFEDESPAEQNAETVAVLEEYSEDVDLVAETPHFAATNIKSAKIENIDLTDVGPLPVDAGETTGDSGRVADTDDVVFMLDERPRRGLGTWIVLVVALIALPAQVLWFQYAEWVEDDAYRPIYSYICKVAGCELPPRRNVGLIVATNSVLRDHPDRKGAVVYDALLFNRARYEQPFPYVELTLTTMGGQLVASRRFHPNEYLNGEAASAKMMRSRTPVHISLEMKDPGQAPLNFQIRFVPTD